MQFERHNPLTGAVASSAQAMQAAEIPAIAARAGAGFRSGRKWAPMRAVPF
jgi:hypothetical protein